MSMTTHLADSPDLDAMVRVSSRSLWTDSQWLFDGMRPGLRSNRFRIDWSFALPEEGRFTDPRWAGWLEDTRQFVWSMRVDPPSGRRRARFVTLVSASYKLRILIRWMIDENMRG